MYFSCQIYIIVALDVLIAPISCSMVSLALHQHRFEAGSRTAESQLQVQSLYLLASWLFMLKYMPNDQTGKQKCQTTTSSKQKHSNMSLVPVLCLTV